MSKIDYDTATLTITCFRKHLLLDSKYYLYVLPNLLVLASVYIFFIVRILNNKIQNIKYHCLWLQKLFGKQDKKVQ